jgi:hypothetical protein
MALMDGDEAAQLAALDIFERLGARPIIEKLKQKMRAEGIRVPRGPRPATREHPFGLTAAMEVSPSGKGSTNNAIAKGPAFQRTVSTTSLQFCRRCGCTANEAVILVLKDNLLPAE